MVDGDWDQLKDEYGDEMIRLLMEAHGYTAREAEQSLAGGERGEEEGSVIVVIEHGDRTQRPRPVSAVAEKPGRQRRGRGGGGRARGGGGGGARVRKQRDTTSRYGTGAFAVMEASLRGRGADDGVT